MLPLIKQRDPRGFDLLAAMYGGMGCLNDLILAKVNGHNIGDHEKAAANASLRTGLNRAHEIVAELRRDIILRSIHQKQTSATNQ